MYKNYCQHRSATVPKTRFFWINFEGKTETEFLLLRHNHDSLSYVTRKEKNVSRSSSNDLELRRGVKSKEGVIGV